MTAVRAAPSGDITGHLPQMLPSLASSSPPSSSTPLHRRASSSSSATAHPLDSMQSSEGKAPSSTSSSPTNQSHSSSSNHKSAASTGVSSILTAGSLSPPSQPHSSRNTDRKQHQPPRRTHSFNNEDGTSETSTVTSPTTRPITQHHHHQPSSRANQTPRISSGQRLMEDNEHDRKWSYSRHDDNDDDPYAQVDEEDSANQYPPLSEGDKEARAIEVNLERWASEERRRRKAMRASRTTSMNGSQTLTKRLSVLGMLGSKQAPVLPLQHKDVESERSLGLDRTGSRADSDESLYADARSDLAQDIRPGSAQGDAMAARKSAKGKGRAGSDPFRDPSTTSTSSSSPRKPSGRAPIVTPGRAPTSSHRILEHSRQNGSAAMGMPSIVATDVDEEGEITAAKSANPFSAAAEVDGFSKHGREDSQKTTLSDEDGLTRPVMPPVRKSMSSSKFNEIGLESSEDLGTAASAQTAGPDKPSPSPPRTPAEGTQDRGRRTHWWSELLCGCGSVVDEDGEQQTGQTCPE